MKTAIVGLGLIGGSMAKAIKKNTRYSCFGLDIDASAVKSALEQEAIDEQLRYSHRQPAPAANNRFSDK